MAKFRMMWSVWLEAEIDANNEEEALDWLMNCDYQHDGTYVEDSFEERRIEEVEPC